MSVDDLKIKYLAVYRSFTKKGSINKLYLLVILIIGSLYSYDYVYNANLRYKYSSDHLSDTTIVLISIGLFILYLVLIFTTNSMYFINSRLISNYKSSFKKDLSALLSQEFPEFEEYIYLQKIRQKTFLYSGLFKSRITDYIGDDWMRFKYKEIEFAVCELHVINFLKPVFNGFFIHFSKENLMDTQVIDFKKQEDQRFAFILDFQEKYNSKVKLSVKNNNIFMSFCLKEYFLENKNTKAINKLDRDIQILKDIIKVVESVVDSVV